MRFGVAVVAVGLSVTVLTAPPVAAQTEFGAFVGHQMDESFSGSVRFGVEARYHLRNSPLQLQPAVSDQPGTGGFPATLRVDVNLLYQTAAAGDWPVEPYLGVGGGYDHVGGEFSANKLVANFVAGFRLKLKGATAITPFVNSEYSFAKQFTNEYHIEIGVLYSPPHR